MADEVSEHVRAATVPRVFKGAVPNFVLKGSVLALTGTAPFSLTQELGQSQEIRGVPSVKTLEAYLMKPDNANPPAGCQALHHSEGAVRLNARAGWRGKSGRE